MLRLLCDECHVRRRLRLAGGRLEYHHAEVALAGRADAENYTLAGVLICYLCTGGQIVKVNRGLTDRGSG